MTAAAPGLVQRHGFGLAFDLLDGLDCPALAPGHGSGRRPATAVRPVPADALDRDWPAARGRVTRELRIGGTLVFSVAHAAGAGYVLDMPGYGRFLVSEDGRDVRCDSPSPERCAEALLSQGLPLACTLRGLEPFHASGVVLGDAALMLTGPVTAGKSSLAAELVEGGASLLADDVVAVEAGDELLAHPGGRWLHLRETETERVEAAAPRRLRRAGGAAGRARWEAPASDDPRPLRAVYVLQRGELAVAQLAGPAVALLGATYNLSVREPARLRRQLDLAHRIAATAGVFAVGVPEPLDAPRVAAALRAHFESVA